MINFEDFQKIELRAAKILEAEKVEGSEKLIKLDRENEIKNCGIIAYAPDFKAGKEGKLVPKFFNKRAY